MPTGLGTIVAVQDRDCIDRAKFRCVLPAPLPVGTFDHFADADIVLREFSKIVPLGRDLFSIVKPCAFRVDGIVGDDKLIVTFEGDPVDWPADLLGDFQQRLQLSGYAGVHYMEGDRLRCCDCSARFTKRCRGLEHAEPPPSFTPTPAFQVGARTHLTPDRLPS